MASLSMALLPSYSAIGIVSCYIIVLVRIIQGISVGGEYSGAIIYAIEHVNKKNVGIVGAIVLSGCVSGVILAFIVSNFLQTAWLPEYSWRFAFVLGGGLSFLGYFIRRRLKETPIFQASKASILKAPLLEGLKTQKLKMLAVIFLSGTSNANFYYAVVFVPNFLKNQTGNTTFSGLFFVTVMFLIVPFIGWILDRLNRGKLLFISCMLIAIFDWFYLTLLHNETNILLLNIITISYAIVLSFVFVTVNIYVLEIFLPQYRFSCGATSYSLGAAFLGGTAPMICSLIVKTYDNNLLYLSGYISLISILGAIASGGLLFLHKKRLNAIQ
jgi:MHS family proline/betaine transporter-like MFS transporter